MLVIVGVVVFKLLCTMTTFKEAPVYAEYLLSTLDAARRSEGALSLSDVLGAVRWRFKGGSMADALTHTRTEHSDSYFVDVTSAELAKEMRLRESVDQATPGSAISRTRKAKSRDWLSLEEILRNRKSARPMRRVAMESRLATFAALGMSEGAPVKDGYLWTGLSAVYRVFEEIWLVGQDNTGPREMWSPNSHVYRFVREMLVASSLASYQHAPTVDQVAVSAMKLVGTTRAAWLMEQHRALEVAMAASTCSRARNAARHAGSDLYNSPRGRADWRRAGEGVTKTYDVPPIAGRRVEIYFGVIAVKIGAHKMVLSTSDMKRLIQMSIASASCLVAACAQACTGPPMERRYGPEMVKMMEANITDMVTVCRSQELGSEVKACKGLKKAFTVYMGKLSGPLCAPETAILRAEAIAELPDHAAIVDTWVARCARLPPALGFNAGKVYKILPAPDSAPGGTVIDRLKAIDRPNQVSSAMMADFEAELTDHIVYGRLAMRGAPKLSLRPRVARPAWWSDYLRGRMSSVPISNCRNVVAWEKSLDMPVRNALDPSVWKDSGLASDHLEDGLGDTEPWYMRNMLARMVFDENCPMPGDEERIAAPEFLSKSDGKPESHKDPYRSIFSAALRVRFEKSRMELAVEEVASSHPSFMIGAPYEKREERIRAATTSTCAMGCTPFFYSFDVKGWSPSMPAVVQKMSHRIWGSLYRTTLFDTATRCMQGATVYMNSGGYKCWYKNTEANFEGYDGKEMTMLNVAMLSLSVRNWRANARVHELIGTKRADEVAALLLAYIDDGMARIELPMVAGVTGELFDIFKRVCNDTFAGCGFTIEPSKCFPSDSFFIFLNEAYLGGRHLVHGVRAAGQICSRVAEPHETLSMVTGKISTGCRGAVMAGLDASAGMILMAFHTSLVVKNWVGRMDPIAKAVWCYSARAWGGLGMPVALQLATTASGNALSEAVSLFQKWARVNPAAKRYFLGIMRTPKKQRTKTEILSAPFGSRLQSGYMRDSRLAVEVRKAMEKLADRGALGPLPRDYLKFGDPVAFEKFAEAVVPGEPGDAIQARVLKDLADSHPQAVFKKFCTRIERGTTVQRILGVRALSKLVADQRREARVSAKVLEVRMNRVVA